MAIDVKDKDRGFDSPNLRRFMVHQSIKCLDMFFFDRGDYISTQPW